MKTIKRILVPVTVVMSLAGCGGGGGDSNPPPTPPAPTYTIAGSATGIVGTGLSLRLNGGAALAVSANGAFTFPQALAGGAAYTVTIDTQPSGPTQVCSLASAVGTVAAANVTNVSVTCAAPVYSIGGSVSGLVGTGMTLRLNGASPLVVSANGAFVFGSSLATGATFTATIDVQPSVPTQSCTLAGATGTVAAANITSVAVTCAAPPPASDSVQACRLTNPNPFSLALGFPRHTARLKSSGTVRIKVLFVDFPDVAATETPQQTLARISPNSEAYFAAVSYGRMNVVYEPHLQWLRMGQASNTYGFGSITYQQHHDYLQEAVNRAGAGVDWSTTDGLLVMAAPNATALTNGPAFIPTPGFGVTAGGREILNAATSGNDLNFWGAFWANHELGHTLGLPDLYLSTQPIHRAVGMWSLMGNIAGPAREYTGFERWILGWVDDAQVACATAAGESTVTLAPIERLNGTKKMVVVPLSTTTAVVAEVRRVSGFDAGFSPNGVLVYFIDSSLTNSQGAMRVLPINDADSAKGGVTLAAGSSLSHGGVTVRVLQTTTDGDTVLITR